MGLRNLLRLQGNTPETSEAQLTHDDRAIKSMMDRYLARWHSSPEEHRGVNVETVSTPNGNVLVFCDVQSNSSTIREQLTQLTSLALDQDPGSKNGMCRYLPETMHQELQFDHHLRIVPTQAGNLRGGTGITYEHFAAGKTLRSGYLIADLTNPPTTPNLRKSKHPEALVVYADTFERAVEIFNYIYGGAAEFIDWQ